MTKFVLLTDHNNEPIYVNPAMIVSIEKKIRGDSEMSKLITNIFMLGDERRIAVKGSQAEVVAEILRQQKESEE